MLCLNTVHLEGLWEKVVCNQFQTTRTRKLNFRNGLSAVLREYSFSGCRIWNDNQASQLIDEF